MSLNGVTITAFSLKYAFRSPTGFPETLAEAFVRGELLLGGATLGCATVVDGTFESRGWEVRQPLQQATKIQASTAKPVRSLEVIGVLL
ncbi:MAG: hypothetical protein ACXVIV_02995 [Halobacteriota archaeon]